MKYYNKEPEIFLQKVLIYFIDPKKEKPISGKTVPLSPSSVD
jgi:hypothetical protein